LARRVESYIAERIASDGAIHMTLIDPEKTPGHDCCHMAREAEAGGTAAIMVGGSTSASGVEMDEAIEGIKATVKIPVIDFSNNLTSLSRHADAL